MRRYLVAAFLIFFQFMGQSQTRGDTVYFWISKIFGCPDGYVLPLSNPTDIAHARELIATHGMCGQPLVVARISDDFNGLNINRMYCDYPAPSWSWYVTDFLGFADSTPEIYDGTPTQVENGTFAGGAKIGFWGYTVKDELGTEINPWCEVLEYDCVADIYDLEILTAHWLQENCEYPDWCSSADLDVSGTVNFFDFALLAEQWIINH